MKLQNIQTKKNYKNLNINLSSKKESILMKSIMKNKVLLIMLLPALLYFIIFSYVPMVGVIVAFKNYNFSDGIFGSPWVGFENFKYFFISGQALRVTRNTFLYNSLFIIVNTVLQMGLAILISEIGGKFFKKILKLQCFYLTLYHGL